MRIIALRLMLMFGLLLTSCCSGYAQPPAAANIDWAQTPLIKISLTLRRFNPREVVMHKGEPVRLVFSNSSGTTHDFVTGFFQDVSQRPGVKQGGTRVILQPADRVTYYVVPLAAGSYSVSTIMFVPPGLIPSAIIEVN